MQHMARFKAAYFSMKHPTVSLHAGSETTVLAQTIFQDLGPMLDDIALKLRQCDVRV